MNRSPRLVSVLVFLAVVASMPLFAEAPLWTLLPKTDDYDSFMDFCKILVERRDGKDMADDADGYDFFALLLAANRDEAVVNLARAITDTDPNDSYFYAGRFINPATAAYRAGKISVMKRLVDADPQTLYWDDMYQRSNGPVLTAVCVAKDDLETLKYLASKGADLQTLYVLGSLYVEDTKTRFFASNLITISRSKRMTDYLVSKGVPEFYKAADYHSSASDPLMAFCKVDSMNLRKSPSPAAPALSRIKRSERFKVLGYSFHDTTLGGGTSRWVEVNYKGTRGWVFGSTIEWDAADYGDLPWSEQRSTSKE